MQRGVKKGLRGAKACVPLRAVRTVLQVLTMRYMPSVALYVVETTFRGDFKSHYPPQFFHESSVLFHVKISAGSFGCTQDFLCLTRRRNRAVSAGANEYRILLPHFMLALGTDIVPNFGFAHFLWTTNSGAFRAMHSFKNSLSKISLPIHRSYAEGYLRNQFCALGHFQRGCTLLRRDHASGHGFYPCH